MDGARRSSLHRRCCRMPGSGWRGGGWSGERPGESWAVLSASMAASAKVVAVASSFGCTLLPVSAEARVPDTQNLVEMWVCASRHCIYLVACTVDLLSTLTNAYRVPSTSPPASTLLKRGSRATNPATLPFEKARPTMCVVQNSHRSQPKNCMVYIFA